MPSHFESLIEDTIFLKELRKMSRLYRVQGVALLKIVALHKAPIKFEIINRISNN